MLNSASPFTPAAPSDNSVSVYDNKDTKPSGKTSASRRKPEKVVEAEQPAPHPAIETIELPEQYYNNTAAG